MNCRLHIEALQQGSRTILANSFATSPLKIADVTEHKNGPLNLMLMSSSPGILSGDVYQMAIDVHENAALHLHTQSYQRLFTMDASATQQVDVSLAAGASCTFIAHPLVPHLGSSFTACNTIHMHRSAQMIWGDILTSGRKTKSEHFSFNKLHVLTKVYVDEVIVIHDNQFMQPAVTDYQALGLWQGYSHQANLLVVAQNVQNSGHLPLLQAILNEQKDITAGISCPAPSILVMRILGLRGEQLYNLLHKLAACLQTSIPKCTLHDE